jgi:hypothetical protein
LEGLLGKWFRGEKSVGKKLVGKKFVGRWLMGRKSAGKKVCGGKKKFSGERDVGAKSLFGES